MAWWKIIVYSEFQIVGGENIAHWDFKFNIQFYND